MSVIIQGSQLRQVALGTRVQGKTSTFVAGGGTHQVFTVAGGEVLITSLYGKVTTAISLDAHKLSLQVDPTAGTTVVWVAATDLGTTDTAVGDLLGVAVETNDTANNQINFAVNGEPLLNRIAQSGEIEVVDSNETGTEVGVVQWFCTYVPLTDGATVVASA